MLLRRDGVPQLDIRLTLRTDDDELIYVSCDGIFDIAPGVRERIVHGADVDSSEYYFRTALGSKPARRDAHGSDGRDL